MKSFVRLLQNVGNSLVSRRAPRSPKHRRSDFLTRPMVENLEHRRLLATFYVDNTAIGAAGAGNGTFTPNGGDQTAVSGLTLGTNLFTTIGAAVAAAAASAGTDVINVADGTYAERVNIAETGLTVQGNQYLSDGQDLTRGTETIVTGVGNNGETPFNISATDVQVSGFTIEGATNSNVFGFGVLIGAGTAGTELRNNVIQNNIAGISLANNSATNQTLILGNLIRNNNQPGPISGTGIYSDQFNSGGALTNVLIDTNTFSGNDNVAVLLGSTSAAAQASNITITCNIMTGNGNAALLFNTINSTITQNDISSSTGSQVVLGGGDNGVAITQNFIENGATRGIRIGDFGGGSSNQNITINRNSIEGNATAGLEIEVGGYIGAPGSLNAQFNWWGSSTGPTIASNPGGNGQAIVDPAGQVNYVPFLPNGVDTEPAVCGFQPSIADLSITKTDAPDPVSAGSTVTYTIIVTNNGPDTQTGATVTDTFPASLTNVTFTSVVTGGATGNTASGTGNINDTVTLPSASTITYTVTGTVPSSAPVGTLTNTATVTAPVNTFETDTTNNSATATTDVNQRVDVSVTKTDSPDPMTAGSNLTYTIVVNNSGPSDAQTLSLSDAIPANTTFVSLITPAGWSSTTPVAGGTGTITSTRATLAAGTGPQTFTLVVKANANTPSGTVITNSASVSTTTTDTNANNNNVSATTTVNTSADLSVTKSGTPSVVVAGQNLTYTIVVTNNGVSDAQGVSLSDIIPPNTTFVSLSSPAGWSNTTPPVGGTGTATSTRATLAAGSGPQTFTLIVKADDAAPNASTITNTAVVAATTPDPNGTNNSDSSSSTVNATADVTVDKTASSDSAFPGQNLTYTIIVSNNGVVAAQNVSLSDLIPADTTFVSFTAPAGWVSSTPPVGGTGLVTSDIPSLAVGASATFTLVVQVSPTAAEGTVISNSADVTTTTVESDDTNNTSGAEVNVTQAVLQDCDVTTLNQPGALGSATLGDDADNTGTGVLIVTGTNKSDVIVIEERPANHSQIRVTVNGQLKGFYNKSDVQHIVAFGLNGNDTIIVGWNLEQNATLFGGAGTDFLFGGAGQDAIDGGAGNDHLFGGWDNDMLCGGDGNDLLYGQFNDDFLGGDAGNDFLYGEGGNDQLQGGTGNDYLFGGVGNDRLFGQVGNDNLFGENGNDIAVGGDGNDRLWGGEGRDLLIGGAGDDTMYGEGHDDILVANSTVYDNNTVALMSILMEWTSSRSYGTRVSNIRSGGGSNGGFTLNGGTVQDDGRPDTLWGNGGQDWFLTGVKDRIRDKAANELVN
jgi:uncharacterized repeat protein (TIGR01451 family)